MSRFSSTRDHSEKFPTSSQISSFSNHSYPNQNTPTYTTPYGARSSSMSMYSGNPSMSPGYARASQPAPRPTHLGQLRPATTKPSLHNPHLHSTNPSTSGNASGYYQRPSHYSSSSFANPSDGHMYRTPTASSSTVGRFTRLPISSMDATPHSFNSSFEVDRSMSRASTARRAGSSFDRSQLSTSSKSQPIIPLNIFHNNKVFSIPIYTSTSPDAFGPGFRLSSVTCAGASAQDIQNFNAYLQSLLNLPCPLIGMKNVDSHVVIPLSVLVKSRTARKNTTFKPILPIMTPPTSPPLTSPPHAYVSHHMTASPAPVRIDYGEDSDEDPQALLSYRAVPSQRSDATYASTGIAALSSSSRARSASAAPEHFSFADAAHADSDAVVAADDDKDFISPATHAHTRPAVPVPSSRPTSARAPAPTPAPPVPAPTPAPTRTLSSATSRVPVPPHASERLLASPSLRMRSPAAKRAASRAPTARSMNLSAHGTQTNTSTGANVSSMPPTAAAAQVLPQGVANRFSRKSSAAASTSASAKPATAVASAPVAATVAVATAPVTSAVPIVAPSTNTNAASATADTTAAVLQLERERHAAGERLERLRAQLPLLTGLVVADHVASECVALEQRMAALLAQQMTILGLESSSPEEVCRFHQALVAARTRLPLVLAGADVTVLCDVLTPATTPTGTLLPRAVLRDLTADALVGAGVSSELAGEGAVLLVRVFGYLEDHCGHVPASYMHAAIALLAAASDDPHQLAATLPTLFPRGKTTFSDLIDFFTAVVLTLEATGCPSAHAPSLLATEAALLAAQTGSPCRLFSLNAAEASKQPLPIVPTHTPAWPLAQWLCDPEHTLMDVCGWGVALEPDCTVSVTAVAQWLHTLCPVLPVHIAHVDVDVDVDMAGSPVAVAASISTDILTSSVDAPVVEVAPVVAPPLPPVPSSAPAATALSVVKTTAAEAVTPVAVREAPPTSLAAVAGPVAEAVQPVEVPQTHADVPADASTAAEPAAAELTLTAASAAPVSAAAPVPVPAERDPVVRMSDLQYLLASALAPLMHALAHPTQQPPAPATVPALTPAPPAERAPAIPESNASPETPFSEDFGRFDGNIIVDASPAPDVEQLVLQPRPLRVNSFGDEIGSVYNTRDGYLSPPHVTRTPLSRHATPANTHVPGSTLDMPVGKEEAECFHADFEATRAEYGLPDYTAHYAQYPAQVGASMGETDAGVLANAQQDMDDVEVDGDVDAGASSAPRGLLRLPSVAGVGGVAVGGKDKVRYSFDYNAYSPSNAALTPSAAARAAAMAGKAAAPPAVGTAVGASVSAVAPVSEALVWAAEAVPVSVAVADVVAVSASPERTVPNLALVLTASTSLSASPIAHTESYTDSSDSLCNAHHTSAASSSPHAVDAVVPVPAADTAEPVAPSIMPAVPGYAAEHAILPPYPEYDDSYASDDEPLIRIVGGEVSPLPTPMHPAANLPYAHAHAYPTATTAMPASVTVPSPHAASGLPRASLRAVQHQNTRPRTGSLVEALLASDVKDSFETLAAQDPDRDERAVSASTLACVAPEAALDAEASASAPTGTFVDVTTDVQQHVDSAEADWEVILTDATRSRDDAVEAAVGAEKPPEQDEAQDVQLGQTPMEAVVDVKEETVVDAEYVHVDVPVAVSVVVPVVVQPSTVEHVETAASPVAEDRTDGVSAVAEQRTLPLPDIVTVGADVDVGGAEVVQSSPTASEQHVPPISHADNAEQAVDAYLEQSIEDLPLVHALPSGAQAAASINITATTTTAIPTDAAADASAAGDAVPAPVVSVASVQLPAPVSVTVPTTPTTSAADHTPTQSTDLPPHSAPESAKSPEKPRFPSTPHSTLTLQSVSSPSHSSTPLLTTPTSHSITPSPSARQSPSTNPDARAAAQQARLRGRALPGTGALAARTPRATAMMNKGRAAFFTASSSPAPSPAAAGGSAASPARPIQPLASALGNTTPRGGVAPVGASGSVPAFTYGSRSSFTASAGVGALLDATTLATALSSRTEEGDLHATNRAASPDAERPSLTLSAQCMRNASSQDSDEEEEKSKAKDSPVQSVEAESGASMLPVSIVIEDVDNRTCVTTMAVLASPSADAGSDTLRAAAEGKSSSPAAAAPSLDDAKAELMMQARARDGFGTQASVGLAVAAAPVVAEEAASLSAGFPYVENGVMSTSTAAGVMDMSAMSVSLSVGSPLWGIVEAEDEEDYQTLERSLSREVRDEVCEGENIRVAALVSELKAKEQELLMIENQLAALQELSDGFGFLPIGVDAHDLHARATELEQARSLILVQGQALLDEIEAAEKAKEEAKKQVELATATRRNLNVVIREMTPVLRPVSIHSSPVDGVQSASSSFPTLSPMNLGSVLSAAAVPSPTASAPAGAEASTDVGEALEVVSEPVPASPRGAVPAELLEDMRHAALMHHIRYQATHGAHATTDHAASATLAAVLRELKQHSRRTASAVDATFTQYTAPAARAGHRRVVSDSGSVSTPMEVDSGEAADDTADDDAATGPRLEGEDLVELRRLAIMHALRYVNAHANTPTISPALARELRGAALLHGVRYVQSHRTVREADPVLLAAIAHAAGERLSRERRRQLEGSAARLRDSEGPQDANAVDHAVTTSAEAAAVDDSPHSDTDADMYMPQADDPDRALLLSELRHYAVLHALRTREEPVRPAHDHSHDALQRLLVLAGVTASANTNANNTGAGSARGSANGSEALGAPMRSFSTDTPHESLDSDTLPATPTSSASLDHVLCVQAHGDHTVACFHTAACVATAEYLGAHALNETNAQALHAVASVGRIAAASDDDDLCSALAAHLALCAVDHMAAYLRARSRVIPQGLEVRVAVETILRDFAAAPDAESDTALATAAAALAATFARYQIDYLPPEVLSLRLRDVVMDGVGGDSIRGSQAQESKTRRAAFRFTEEEPEEDEEEEAVYRDFYDAECESPASLNGEREVVYLNEADHLLAALIAHGVAYMAFMAARNACTDCHHAHLHDHAQGSVFGLSLPAAAPPTTATAPAQSQTQMDALLLCLSDIGVVCARGQLDDMLWRQLQVLTRIHVRRHAKAFLVHAGWHPYDDADARPTPASSAAAAKPGANAGAAATQGDATFPHSCLCAGVAGAIALWDAAVHSSAQAELSRKLERVALGMALQQSRENPVHMDAELLGAIRTFAQYKQQEERGGRGGVEGEVCVNLLGEVIRNPQSTTTTAPGTEGSAEADSVCDIHGMRDSVLIDALTQLESQAALAQVREEEEFRLQMREEMEEDEADVDDDRSSAEGVEEMAVDTSRSSMMLTPHDRLLEGIRRAALAAAVRGSQKQLRRTALHALLPTVTYEASRRQREAAIGVPARSAEQRAASETLAQQVKRVAVNMAIKRQTHAPVHALSAALRKEIEKQALMRGAHNCIGDDTQQSTQQQLSGSDSSSEESSSELALAAATPTPAATDVELLPLTAAECSCLRQVLRAIALEQTPLPSSFISLAHTRLRLLNSADVHTTGPVRIKLAAEAHRAALGALAQWATEPEAAQSQALYLPAHVMSMCESVCAAEGDSDADLPALDSDEEEQEADEAVLWAQALADVRDEAATDATGANTGSQAILALFRAGISPTTALHLCDQALTGSADSPLVLFLRLLSYAHLRGIDAVPAAPLKPSRQFHCELTKAALARDIRHRTQQHPLAHAPGPAHTPQQAQARVAYGTDTLAQIRTVAQQVHYPVLPAVDAGRSELLHELQLQRAQAAADAEYGAPAVTVPAHARQYLLSDIRKAVREKPAIPVLPIHSQAQHELMRAIRSAHLPASMHEDGAHTDATHTHTGAACIVGDVDALPRPMLRRGSCHDESPMLRQVPAAGADYIKDSIHGGYTAGEAEHARLGAEGDADAAQLAQMQAAELLALRESINATIDRDSLRSSTAQQAQVQRMVRDEEEESSRIHQARLGGRRRSMDMIMGLQSLIAEALQPDTRDDDAGGSGNSNSVVRDTQADVGMAGDDGVHALSSSARSGSLYSVSELEVLREDEEIPENIPKHIKTPTFEAFAESSAARDYASPLRAALTLPPTSPVGMRASPLSSPSFAALSPVHARSPVPLSPPSASPAGDADSVHIALAYGLGRRRSVELFMPLVPLHEEEERHSRSTGADAEIKAEVEVKMHAQPTNTADADFNAVSAAIATEDGVVCEDVEEDEEDTAVVRVIGGAEAVFVPVLSAAAAAPLPVAEDVEVASDVHSEGALTSSVAVAEEEEDADHLASAVVTDVVVASKHAVIAHPALSTDDCVHDGMSPPAGGFDSVDGDYDAATDAVVCADDDAAVSDDLDSFIDILDELAELQAKQQAIDAALAEEFAAEAAMEVQLAPANASTAPARAETEPEHADVSLHTSAYLPATHAAAPVSPNALAGLRASLLSLTGDSVEACELLESIARLEARKEAMQALERSLVELEEVRQAVDAVEEVASGEEYGDVSEAEVVEEVEEDGEEANVSVSLTAEPTMQVEIAAEVEAEADMYDNVYAADFEDLDGGGDGDADNAVAKGGDLAVGYAAVQSMAVGMVGHNAATATTAYPSDAAYEADATYDEDITYNEDAVYDEDAAYHDEVVPVDVPVASAQENVEDAATMSADATYREEEDVETLDTVDPDFVYDENTTYLTDVAYEEDATYGSADLTDPFAGSTNDTLLDTSVIATHATAPISTAVSVNVAVEEQATALDASAESVYEEDATYNQDATYAEDSLDADVVQPVPHTTTDAVAPINVTASVAPAAENLDVVLTSSEPLPITALPAADARRTSISTPASNFAAERRSSLSADPRSSVIERRGSTTLTESRSSMLIAIALPTTPSADVPVQVATMCIPTSLVSAHPSASPFTIEAQQPIVFDAVTGILSGDVAGMGREDLSPSLASELSSTHNADDANGHTHTDALDGLVPGSGAAASSSSSSTSSPRSHTHARAPGHNNKNRQASRSSSRAARRREEIALNVTANGYLNSHLYSHAQTSSRPSRANPADDLAQPSAAVSVLASGPTYSLAHSQRAARTPSTSTHTHTGSGSSEVVERLPLVQAPLAKVALPSTTGKMPLSYASVLTSAPHTHAPAPAAAAKTDMAAQALLLFPSPSAPNHNTSTNTNTNTTAATAAPPTSLSPTLATATLTPRTQHARKQRPSPANTAAPLGPTASPEPLPLISPISPRARSATPAGASYAEILAAPSPMRPRAPVPTRVATPTSAPAQPAPSSPAAQPKQQGSDKTHAGKTQSGKRNRSVSRSSSRPPKPQSDRQSSASTRTPAHAPAVEVLATGPTFALTPAHSRSQSQAHARSTDDTASSSFSSSSSSSPTAAAASLPRSSSRAGNTRARSSSSASRPHTPASASPAAAGAVDPSPPLSAITVVATGVTYPLTPARSRTRVPASPSASLSQEAFDSMPRDEDQPLRGSLARGRSRSQAPNTPMAGVPGHFSASHGEDHLPSEGTFHTPHVPLAQAHTPKAKRNASRTPSRSSSRASGRKHGGSAAADLAAAAPPAAVTVVASGPVYALTPARSHSVSAARTPATDTGAHTTSSGANASAFHTPAAHTPTPAPAPALVSRVLNWADEDSEVGHDLDGGRASDSDASGSFSSPFKRSFADVLRGGQ